jgi:hypothetical protein
MFTSTSVYEFDRSVRQRNGLIFKVGVFSIFSGIYMNVCFSLLPFSLFEMEDYLIQNHSEENNGDACDVDCI